MATSQILSFGGAAGANVLTPAEYAALSARTSGFLSGVAKSKEVNTPLRQAAFVAAMIGQFIAVRGGIDVLDDGDVVGLEADFVAAITSFLQSRVATTAQAQELVNDSVLLTPKKLDDAFSAGRVLTGTSLNQSIAKGTILKAGFFSETATSVAFPTPFPNACLGVFGAESATIPGNMGFVVFQYTALTRFSFQPQLRDANKQFPNAANIKFLAIGY